MKNTELPNEYKPSEKLLALYYEKRKQEKIGVIIPAGNGNIPILYANGKSVAEAWENSMINLWINGCLVKTQYDTKEELPSRDCTMLMVIEEPLSEPRIHRAFPGGLEDLEEYRQEVLDGIKDHWIRDPNDPKDTRWEYTYHERMRKYNVPGLERAIDQFEQMAQSIAKSPITRRAQMISWQPWMDNNIADPACWQSLWGRCMISEEDKQLYLNLNMRFRSRDAYDAAFMNIFAFTLLGEKLAQRISELSGKEVKPGRFMDYSDSYHIYGKRFDDFNERFIRAIDKRTFEGRTWTTLFAQPVFDAAKPVIRSKIKKQDKEHRKAK